MKYIKTTICLLAVLIANSAAAAVLHVPGQYTTIQAAINACKDYDTVIVAPGIYSGLGNRNITLNGKSITVCSTDPSDPQIVNTTVIDCQGSGHGFIFYMGENADSTVTGLTITNGYALLGGAVYCYNNSSPSITNCLITNNSAVFGGGIACANSKTYPEITNCRITANSALIGGGAIYCNGAGPKVRNCIISGNSSLNGGAIYSHNAGNPVIANCTISANTASSSAGAIYCYKSSNLTINNCILWADTAAYALEVLVGNLGAATSIQISYCDINDPDENVIRDTGCTINWGQGNIDADPCFVEPGYWDMNDVWVEGDYHLLVGSPCIDAGDNTAVPTDTTDRDLDGNPRIVDGNDDGNLVVDMGAYEYEAMVSCFGVNHVKLETKAGKKGNKVELKGTFSPALPIDFAVDDVAYIIDDGQGNTMAFLIPAGSFEPDGKPEKQKFKFDSPKYSQPDIKAKFDFDKCKFELKAKRVQGTDEITSTTLTIELWAGANVAQELVEVKIKPRHLEYKRKPKLNRYPKCKGIALLEVTSTDPFTGDEYVLLFEPDPFSLCSLHKLPARQTS